MKTIKASAYEKLSNRQRIIASIEAASRNDLNEKNRLIRTCPKKRYRQTDKDYSDKIEALFQTALFVECELRGYALSFEYFMRTKHPPLIFMQKFVNLHTAWQEILSSFGIDPDSMKKATILAHPVMDIMREALANLSPEYTEVADLRENLRQRLGMFS